MTEYIQIYYKMISHQTAILAALVLIVGLLSCQFNGKPNTESLKKNIVYFKDPTTNLCFAGVNSTNTKSLSNNSSITCVPCDSLKKINIK